MGSYQLTWLPLCGGQLALGHRPGKALRKRLQDENCTLTVSLLSESESQAAETANRIRLPLHTANPPAPEFDESVNKLLATILSELNTGGRVFLHCSAGLHRTGMMAYAFFRYLGHSRVESIRMIRQLRELTASELTEPRLVWGEKFANGVKDNNLAI